MNSLLEICVDSIESAWAANEGGADRLEVCGPLASGGTTPSLGLIKQCVEVVKLPVMMMVRPHDGGFVYREDDIQVMLADIEAAKDFGIQGVVFGALTDERRIDVAHCQRLLAAAKPLEATFHRAFDVAADPLESLEQIVELGFDRLLTSGQAESAEQGIPLLRQLFELAENRIALIAGAGVNSGNVRQIVDSTGIGEVHASASVSEDRAQSNGVGEFGGARRVANSALVREIRRALP